MLPPAPAPAEAPLEAPALAVPAAPAPRDWPAQAPPTTPPTVATVAVETPLTAFDAALAPAATKRPRWMANLEGRGMVGRRTGGKAHAVRGGPDERVVREVVVVVAGACGGGGEGVARVWRGGAGGACSQGDAGPLINFLPVSGGDRAAEAAAMRMRAHSPRGAAAAQPASRPVGKAQPYCWCLPASPDAGAGAVSGCGLRAAAAAVWQVPRDADGRPRGPAGRLVCRG